MTVSLIKWHTHSPFRLSTIAGDGQTGGGEGGGERELYEELSITRGLGRRPRTDSASPHYGLIDRVIDYVHGEHFPLSR